MAQRRSLVTRRQDVGAPLRPPAGPTQYDSALRSDFSYIPEDLDPPEAILQARDIDHTSIEVSFDPLSIPVDPNFGAPTEIALVRSPSGYPTTILDGVMVRRHPPEAPVNEGWVRIPDTGLSPGTWYYYGLFAKYEYEGNTHWLQVGKRSILLPAEFLSGDHLWERVPEWYRRADMDPGGKRGLLRRLIDTVGYQTDAHRTWAFTIGDVWDAEKISADLLPYLGDTLGQPVEYAAGDERYRALISRILPLRKLKGTEFGTEAYLSSITGYRTRVYSGLNLLPTVNEAEALYTSGLWTKTGTATLTRVMSTGSPAGSPAAGTFYHRLTHNGTSNQRPAFRLGDGVNLAKMVPVTAGHDIATSAFFCSSFTGAWNVRYRWFDTVGAVVGTDTTENMGTIGTTWTRRLAPAVTVPAGASFVELNMELSVNTTTDALTVEFTNMLVADLSWRPEDVPGAINTPPLSTNDAGSLGKYDHEMYYEPPRTVHVNVYPQRINYALNSEFTMDNLPAGAWTVAERATWGLLKEAYTSWGDITDIEPGDHEEDWGDLAEGFAPLAGSWTMAFDTTYDVANGHGRLVLTPAVDGAPDYITQVQSHFVPVVAGDSISAAFVSWATKPGVEIMFSAEFFTDDDAAAALSIDGVKQDVHGKAWTMTDTPYRYELRSVLIPEGAAYARIIVETRGSPEVTSPVLDPETGEPTGEEVTTGTGTYVAYLGQALIENAQVPGPYFNGNEVDSAYGDFFFIGQPHLSYSVYYQNYRSFINYPLGGDRITSLMAELLPMATDFEIRTAAGGLY